ncbi:hypothetical protein ACWEPR_34800 [Streptomyces sp. NPDC004290]
MTAADAASAAAPVPPPVEHASVLLTAGRAPAESVPDPAPQADDTDATEAVEETDTTDATDATEEADATGEVTEADATGEAEEADATEDSQDLDAPAPAAAGRPRLGTVAIPEPSRVPPARRRDLPAVRAVRLTDGPPVPADRPGPAAAPAAVTPVPLPLSRPAPRAVPTESRTEEPQP